MRERHDRDEARKPEALTGFRDRGVTVRLKLTIQYDGTDLSGWQSQPGESTVQGWLEDALETFGCGRIAVHGAGRTDAGVHALGQVAHVDIDKELEPETWLRAINVKLPADIRVVRIEPVPETFQARRSAKGKVYCYRAFTGVVLGPFVRRYVAHAPYAHDLDRMNEAAGMLIGRHDFEAFTVTDRDTLTTTRDLRRLDISVCGDELRIEAEANGFLRSMVRTIAGTLLSVGDGRMPVEQVHEALETRRRDKAGPTAPARGLTLVRVDY